MKMDTLNYFQKKRPHQKSIMERDLLKADLIFSRDFL